jgi:hypothetical protein
MKVLIVADLVTDQDLEAFFVRSALAPSPSIGSPEAFASPYKVDRETRPQFFNRQKLSTRDYAAIFLLNVDGLTGSDWGKLSSYLHEGGGLVIAPGNRVDAATYGSAGAAILPATLEEKKDAPPGTTFARAEYDHPLFNRHPTLLDPELTGFPIYRYWTVKPLDNSRTLLSYSDGKPALLERAIKGSKTGHVLLWTTPLSRRGDRADPAAWNEFPNFWSFLEVLDQTVPYLAGTASEQLNYVAGENAVLTIDPNSKATSYNVESPDPKVSERLSAPTTSDFLMVSAPQKEGQWKVAGKGPNGSESRLGFSVNVSPIESQVLSLKPDDLNGLFSGKNNYQIANNAEELEKEQKIGRIGYDIFPYLMFLILALVTAENVLANKFYRNVKTA